MSVTIKENAPNHSMYLGAPISEPCSMKSKSKTKLRNKVAAKGKKKYFKLFNEKRVCDYITKKITGKSFDLF